MRIALLAMAMAMGLTGTSAYAGGIECYMNGTCECYFAGTCDVKGNPIPVQDLQAGLDPRMAECLGEGHGMDACLKKLYPNRFGLMSGEMPMIQCGSGEGAFRVKLGLPFAEMPREGRVPARFENLGLVMQDYVTTSITPIFSMRAFRFQTAYCEYRMQISEANKGDFYVFNSFVECEGEDRKIECELL